MGTNTSRTAHERTMARITALAGEHTAPTLRGAREQSSSGSSRDRIYLYEPIGGWFGVTAADVVDQLSQIDADTLEVHLNSPGGDVFDGVAIANALRQHSARVEVHVDGLAASIASVIAMGGDEVIMHPGSQLMIHDASGVCIGPAEDMRKMAEDLTHISATIAGLYAGKAGGTPQQWRDAMLAETWYDPAEAVDAGLADRAAAGKPSAGDAATARWDLSVFAHAGRPDQPASPFMPTGAAAAVAQVGASSPCPDRPVPPGTGSPTPDASGDTSQEGSTLVDFTDEQLTTLRQRVGVPVDADADTILGALDEALAERADTTAASAVPDGMVLMDQQVRDQLVADATAGRAARDQQIAEHRAALVDAAIQDGRVPVARRDHWAAALAADPEGAEQLLASLSPGLVNTTEHGHASPDGGEDSDPVYAAMYGDEEAN